MEIGGQMISIAVAALAALLLARRWKAMDWLLSPCRHLARWRVLCAVLLAGISLYFNCVLARCAFPQPRIHDEFSYLLAADTFSHGRLTNPTHALWPFFETFHVLQRPSYMSKYPPGQGLMLALGKVLAGEPIVGAWIAAAVLCVAAYWMLNGFFSPLWSFACAMLLAVHPLIAQWSQTYWGGSVAAIGGVLVLGAWVRLIAKPRWSDGALLGIGLVILAISRPFEGAAFALPIMISLLLRPRLALIATGALVALGAIWLGYYNYRVTHHALELPYFAYERQYAVAPPFLFEALRPEPAFRHREMKDYADQIEVPHFLAQRSVSGFLHVAGEKFLRLIQDVADPWLIAIPLLLSPLAAASDRRLWMAVAAGTAVLLATLLSNWTRSQYVAPATGPVLVLFVAGLRWLDSRASAAARGLLLAVVAGAIVLAVQNTRPGSEQFQRSVLTAELNQIDSLNLVLVRYLPGHRLDDEWVYNDADIDASKTVWAHDMGDAENRRLLKYFKDRQVWRLDVDGESAHIQRLALGQ